MMRPESTHSNPLWFTLLIVTVIMTLGSGATARADEDRITLRGSVRLDSNHLEIRLADVAQLEGAVAEALGDSIVYQSSTLPTRPVTININLIRNRLDDLGANLGLVALSGRDCIIRWRAAEAGGGESAESAPTKAAAEDLTVFANTLVDERTIRGVVARYLAQDILRTHPADVQLELRSREMDDLLVSTDGYECEVKPLASRLSATVPLVINLFQGSRVVRSIRVTVGVATRQRVLIVQRYIMRGEILGPGDVNEEIQIVEPQLAAPLNDLNAALGMEVRGRLVPGQILKEGDLVSQVILKRNSEAWVRARHGMFVIRMRARVLDEGRLGELVRVQRLSDRVELRGTVGADGEITVDTGYDDAREEAR